MAAPITHILFALALKKQFTPEFILGTSFPDIRYLGSIDRASTHALQESDIKDTTSFSSGMAFHQYIDEYRGNYWQEKGIYDSLPKSPFTAQALKVYEDIVLYDYYNKWDEIAQVFDIVLEEEMIGALSSEDIALWHQILKSYVTHQLDPETVSQFLGIIGVSQIAVQEIVNLTEKIGAQKGVREAVHSFYHDTQKHLLQKFR